MATYNRNGYNLTASRALGGAPTAAYTAVSRKNYELYQNTAAANQTVDDFKLGNIFWAIHSVKNFDRKIGPGHESHARSVYGDWQIKPCPFIVLAKYPQHLLAVPLLTYGKNGLSKGRQQEIKHEHVGLKHVGSKAEADKDAHPLLEIQEATGSVHPLSQVHFTEPVSFRYSQKMAILGRITKQSYKQLKALWLAGFEGSLDQPKEEKAKVTLTPAPAPAPMKPGFSWAGAASTVSTAKTVKARCG